MLNSLIVASLVFLVGGFFTPPYTYEVFTIWPPMEKISDVPYGFGFPLLIVRTGGFEHAELWDHFSVSALVADLLFGLAAGVVTNRVYGRIRAARHH